MKARIFGTDMIVECLEISWRGDQPGIKCTYLNGAYKDKTGVIPLHALREIEMTKEDRERLDRQKAENSLVRFACVALHAILANPHHDYLDEVGYKQCAKSALDMAQAMVEEMVLRTMTSSENHPSCEPED